MGNCSRPHDIWKDEDGDVHFQTYRQIDRDMYGDPCAEHKVACRTCPSCRMAFADEWATRIMHEAKCYPPGQVEFLTLTYNREHLPERGWLRYHDVQAFLKRLRDYAKRKGLAGQRPIRFVCVGEYGGQLHRPHYHLILFGFAFPDKKPCGKRSGYVVYSSELLNELWRQGTVNEIGTVTRQAAAYCARYALKGGPTAWFPDDWVTPAGNVRHAPKEFLEASRRPGIGYDWYQRFQSSFFPRDFVVIDGRKHRVPGSYYRRLKAEDPVTAELVRVQRQTAIEATVAERTSERLAVQETVLLARLKAGKLPKDRY